MDKVLILTDHESHTKENSLYALAVAFLVHREVERVEVASRFSPLNADFFDCKAKAKLYATTIDITFGFSNDGHSLSNNIREVDLDEFSIVLLRLPPPLTFAELTYFEKRCAHSVIINSPRGIWLTGSKEFLLNFKAFCPPMQVCHDLDDVDAFRRKFAVVLKPFRAYGGKGLIKVEDDSVWRENTKVSYSGLQKIMVKEDFPLLGVKYLNNVMEGDKRIIVVNGHVLGASLRMPPKDSWICNVAMGGSSEVSKVSENEYEMIAEIDLQLNKAGIVMYGVDTLVGDDGKRVLSEINTTSIGGLLHASEFGSKSIVNDSADLVMKYARQLLQEKNKYE